MEKLEMNTIKKIINKYIKKIPYIYDDIKTNEEIFYNNKIIYILYILRLPDRIKLICADDENDIFNLSILEKDYKKNWKEKTREVKESECCPCCETELW